MEWITPKTDWAASTDESGKYTGDYFNITDYNRIKNNIEFLGAAAHQFWPVFVRAMPDRNYQEYPYADEINVLSENLEAINKYVGCDIGEKTEYADNGAFIGFADLNRIESACLKMYEEMRFLYTTLPTFMGENSVGYSGCVMVVSSLYRSFKRTYFTRLCFQMQLF